MKIGLVVLTGNDSGGVFQFTQSVIQSLKLGSDKIVIFIPEEHGKESLALYQAHQCEVRTFKLSDFNLAMKINIVCSHFVPFIPLRKIHFEQFDDIELVFATTPSFFPLSFLQKKMVATIHDFQERYHPQFFTFEERLKRRLLNRAMAKAGSYFLVESQAVKRDLIEFVAVDQNRIVVNPAPANLMLLNFVADPKIAKKVRGKYNLPDSYIYYPAQFWPHKNHTTLLRAFKRVLEQFPDCYLVLSGSKQNYFEQVMQCCRDLSLNERVKYLGFVENDEMPYIYKSASMVVVPSLFESISIPVIEAFCLGVPVACSNVRALPEQIGNSGLIFDPMDPVDIAGKIIALLSNPELRDQLIQLGKERVQMYSPELFLEGLGPIIEKCRHG